MQEERRVAEIVLPTQKGTLMDFLREFAKCPFVEFLETLI